MEHILITEDIHVCYVPATSFPDGVMVVHQQIHALMPATAGRTYYGISRPEKGVIAYKAAATVLDDDIPRGCTPFTIAAGTYAAINIKDFMQHVPAIGEAFRQILALPDIDPDGYCIEEYFNDTDMRCMVRLVPKK